MYKHKNAALQGTPIRSLGRALTVSTIMADLTPHNLVLRSLDNDEPTVINQKIFDILNICLQLNCPREGDIENEGPESFLWEMWGVIISVLEQIPWKHPGQIRLIIEVIRALKDIPGETIDMESWGEMDFWWDLPLLGPAMTCFHTIVLCLIFQWHCYRHRSKRHLECTGSYSHLRTQLCSIRCTSHSDRSR